MSADKPDHPDPVGAHPVRRPDGAHGHSHGGLEGGWAVWLAHPVLRVVLLLVVLAGVSTLLGVVALWPDGTGRAEALERADSIGLTSQRIGAEVAEVSDAPCSYSTDERPQYCRTIAVRPDDGPDAGNVIGLGEFNLSQSARPPTVEAGDRVMVGYEESTDTYFYADRDRRRSLLVLGAVFAGVVIALGRGRGVLALVAMAVTVAVLVAFVAPSVLDGNDPVLVAVVAASAVAFVSLYLTHGVSPTTTVALAGTLLALLLTLGVTSLFFALVQFSGLGTEEALTLPAVVEGIDLPGLLLGGAMLGALGALDDVTVTQVATVAELHARNPALGFGELLGSGVRVGREHIASTVNTLLLAYAGASMPLLLLFAVSNQSLATIANAELIAVEIVRTLCGSIGLVAAVPLTTALAAILLGTGGVAPTGNADWDDFAPDGELEL